MDSFSKFLQGMKILSRAAALSLPVKSPWEVSFHDVFPWHEMRRRCQKTADQRGEVYIIKNKDVHVHSHMLFGDHLRARMPHSINENFSTVPFDLGRNFRSKFFHQIQQQNNNKMVEKDSKKLCPA